VVLEEGSLVFNNKTIDKSLTMNPNDMMIYNKASNEDITQLAKLLFNINLTKNFSRV